MKHSFLIIFVMLFFPSFFYADDSQNSGFSASSLSPPSSNEKIVFHLPPGWRNADQEALPKSVQLMLVGKGEREFPPSICLAAEPYQGTVKDYLKIIKKLNLSRGDDWKSLGTIQTEAGPASLSQTDRKSKWGNLKMLHAIIKKNGTIYILTGTSLKEEFPKFYKDFFDSFRSLSFSKMEDLQYDANFNG